MRGGLSVYLDLVRLLAAFGVLLSHAAGFIMPAIPQQIATNGPECVAVFFVLSGFVIRFASVEKGETNWCVYLAARSARIYSVAPLALLVSAIIATIGSAINPVAYASGQGLATATVLSDGLLSLTFLNEVWFTHTIFGGNEPYWSLGFEVPYYLFFAIVSFAPARFKVLGVVAWTLIFGPKIVAFLPLWLLGVALYDILAKRQAVGRGVGIGMVVTSVALYLGLKFGIQHELHRMYRPTSAMDLLKGMVYFYAIGVTVALNFAGMDAVLRDGVVWNRSVTKVIRWLANGSFTLYLIHGPILALVRASYPTIREHTPQGGIALLATIATCYVLAEVGERRKLACRNLTNRIFSPAVVPRLALTPKQAHLSFGGTVDAGPSSA